MAQRDLKKVKRLARRLEQTRAELRDAILVASESGESVRDIAPFAELSPSRVYDLLKEAEAVRANSDNSGE